MSSRLADAQSAYLRSAAHQPVQWHPWSPEPFERARRENKPILLDIGAVWCHWCHVMDGESTKIRRSRKLLNRDWICIKVDRDERPDVDARYQRAVQALTRPGRLATHRVPHARWRSLLRRNVFPARRSYGRPGFGAILTELAKIYHEQPERVAAQAKEIRTHLAKRIWPSRGPARSSRTFSIRPLTRSDGSSISGTAALATHPSSPIPAPAIPARPLVRQRGTLAPRKSWSAPSPEWRGGGVHDQLGGGFHRYSWMPAGSCRISKRCCTTIPSCCGLRPRRGRRTGGSPPRNGARW